MTKNLSPSSINHQALYVVSYLRPFIPLDFTFRWNTRVTLIGRDAVPFVYCLPGFMREFAHFHSLFLNNYEQYYARTRSFFQDFFEQTQSKTEQIRAKSVA